MPSLKRFGKKIFSDSNNAPINVMSDYHRYGLGLGEGWGW